MTQGEPASSTRASARPTRRLGHVPGLDGLRGIAVLLVILSHTAALWIFGITGIARVDEAFRGGFLGVDLFFVLSGFLITALLLREQTDSGAVRLGAFYGRRALRLLPALYLLLAGHVAYAAVTHLPRHEEVTTVWGALLYVTNWTPLWDTRAVAAGMGHLWSLAVEEQFYLVWPTILILFLGMRRSGRFVTGALATAIVLIGVYRAILWLDGTGWNFLFIRTDTRADSLLVGALLASLWVRGLTPTRGVTRAAWVAVVVLAAIVLIARPDRGFVYLGGFTLFAVAAAVVILATLNGRWSGRHILELRPLRLIGRVSYGLYLWHLPIFVAVDRYGHHWNRLERIAIALPLTAGFTAFSWVVVERPALRLKRRLEPRPQDTPPVPAPVVARTVEATST